MLGMRTLYKGGVMIGRVVGTLCGNQQLCHYLFACYGRVMGHFVQ